MRKQLQRRRRLLTNLALLAFLGGWFVTLAPTVFGGPAAYIEVVGHSMDGTYRTGDLVITRTQDTYAKGDIVAFKVGGGQVIHRIVGGDGEHRLHRPGRQQPRPRPVAPDRRRDRREGLDPARGQGVADAPAAQPWFAGLAAGLLTLVVLGWDARPRRRLGAEDESTTRAERVPSTGPRATCREARMTGPPRCGCGRWRHARAAGGPAGRTAPGRGRAAVVTAAPIQTWKVTDLPEPPEPPVDLSDCGDLDAYDEIVYGTAGDDELKAGNGRQILVGLAGDDTLSGGNHDDCLVGGTGDDRLFGGNGRDLLGQ